ncbi:MAG: HAD family phosphatase [Bernardetiaceae bacterium]|jgi:HAD superfamily hydrolase (TIGR01509 family)|nr:HAD family phosphatase [Bernardetiaceae bacterium]
MTAPFAALFDMDGVIVDSNPYHKLALIRFCEQHGYHLTDDELRTKIYGRTNKEWITNLFNGQVTPAQLRQYADEKEALYRELYDHEVRPVPGLPAFLEDLAQRGIPCAIATSAPRANVDFTLAKTGLARYFPVILDESFVDHGKPNPEIYLKTAAAVGYAPARCLVLEDSIAGVQAGHAAGAKVLAIGTTHSAAELPLANLYAVDFRGLTVEQILAGAFAS